MVDKLSVLSDRCPIPYRQTVDQRSRMDKLKEKRKAALDARMAKIREKRLKKAKGEAGEEQAEGADGAGEESKAKKEVKEEGGGRGVDEDLLLSRLRAVREETESGSRAQERKRNTPEWAKHKIREYARLSKGSYSFLAWGNCTLQVHITSIQIT